MKEVDILQSAIRDYDKILFTIKGWAITIFSAFVFFIAREDDHEYLFLVMAALGTVMFWSLGLIYKSYQQRFLSRYNLIEKYLRNNLQEALADKKLGIVTPDVNGRISVGIVPLRTAALKAARLWHMSLMYAIMMVMLGILLLIEVF